MKKTQHSSENNSQQTEILKLLDRFLSSPQSVRVFRETERKNKEQSEIIRNAVIVPRDRMNRAFNI
jgi:hypothetical protein